jgi:hypothetical protein
MSTVTLNELRNIVRETLKEYKDTTKTININVTGETGKKQYEILQFEQELAKDVFRGSINEQTSLIVQMIENDEWEKPQNAKSFMTSLYSSKRKQFLSPYSESEFNSMKLFKLKNYSIGYAIKSDGDIIAVHNNESFGGLGPSMMKSAIRNGGTKLDHFDGFLTGLYSKNGFPNVKSIDLWNSEYAPDGWNYEKVNIFDAKTSAYANKEEIKKLASNPEEMKNIAKNYNITRDLLDAIRNYETGRPSIIYRVR